MIEDCLHIQTPCDIWKCPYNLFFENRSGNPNHPVAKELMNCVLQVTDPLTLEDIGGVFGLSRERVRQIEVLAITKYLQEISKIDPLLFNNKELSLIQSLKVNHRLRHKLKLHPTGISMGVDQKKGGEP